MSTLLPKRGSVVLQTGIVYEVQMFPCILFVTSIVLAEQSNFESFSSYNVITFTGTNHAEITQKYIRVYTDVGAAIKKDPFAPMKR